MFFVVVIASVRASKRAVASKAAICGCHRTHCFYSCTLAGWLCVFVCLHMTDSVHLLSNYSEWNKFLTLCHINMYTYNDNGVWGTGTSNVVKRKLYCDKRKL